VWDKRLPRDNDGNIVIDESTVCMKHIIRTFLKESSMAMGTTGLPFGDDLSTDEMALASFLHARRVLGMKMMLMGDTHVLKPHDLATATLQKWCPGKPALMKLLYRATRDGWAGRDFHSRCGDDSPSTITLFRVLNYNSTNSVVGGFSSVSWSSSSNRGAFKSSPGAFVFML
ncbi:unnamed protein product, partial [Scytosiphon promiscuus]